MHRMEAELAELEAAQDVPVKEDPAKPNKKDMTKLNQRNAQRNFQNALTNVSARPGGRTAQAADDVFARRSTRPMNYWATAKKGGPLLWLCCGCGCAVVWWLLRAACEAASGTLKVPLPGTSRVAEHAEQRRLLLSAGGLSVTRIAPAVPAKLCTGRQTVFLKRWKPSWKAPLTTPRQQVFVQRRECHASSSGSQQIMCACLLIVPCNPRCLAARTQHNSCEDHSCALVQAATCRSTQARVGK